MINVSLDTQIVDALKRELINQLKSKINQTDIEAVCREQYGIQSIKDCEFIGGDIVIDNNQVAFKVDFDVRFPVSILINNGEDNAITLSEKDVNLLSGIDRGFEESESKETNDTMDEELPDIEFED